jgi:uncharacterized protein Usg
MPERRVDDAFLLQMQGYGLTTANILYRLPDHPAILQTYIWQDYDLAPKFPELERFLEFWNRELEGPIFKVEVAHRRLVAPGEWRAVNAVYGMH